MTVPSRKLKLSLTFLFLLLAANLVVAQKLREGSLVPDGAGGALPGEAVGDAKPSGGAAVTGNGINYNGGPVLKSSVVPIYIIWYGNWTNGPKASDSQNTVNLIDALLGATGGIGGSGYEMINSTYGDNTSNVAGNLALNKQVFDTGSQGTRLRNSRITSIISSQLTSGGLPTDANGVYLVLTSSNISENGFCTQFCGFHTHQTINGADIKWAFIGNVDQCPSGCEIQTTSPNGDSGADGMANVIAHETEEAISDPDLNAWFDSSGQENADKCNFKFGPTQTASNGSKFNQTFGSHNWMLQMNWENSRGGGCDQTKGGTFF